jgi:hypothetical protein
MMKYPTAGGPAGYAQPQPYGGIGIPGQGYSYMDAQFGNMGMNPETI